jgi:hypothetical protein
LHNRHDHTRAFQGYVIAVAMKAGDVRENVSKAIVGSDKSVSLSHIEPFNLARQLDDARLFRYPAARQRRRGRLRQSAGWAPRDDHAHQECASTQRVDNLEFATRY